MGVGWLDGFCKVKIHLQLREEYVCALTLDIQAEIIADSRGTFSESL